MCPMFEGQRQQLKSYTHVIFTKTTNSNNRNNNTYAPLSDKLFECVNLLQSKW